MAALMSAVRRGVSVSGATLYCTTFPCHECARHIIAAGIKRVVFVEPYPKSRAEDLYFDAVEVDAPTSSTRVPFDAYVGVAPRSYTRLFSAPQREEDGRRLVWEEMDRTRSVPRGAQDRAAYAHLERRYAQLFLGQGRHKGTGFNGTAGGTGRVLNTHGEAAAVV